MKRIIIFLISAVLIFSSVPCIYAGTEKNSLVNLIVELEDNAVLDNVSLLYKELKFYLL